MSRPIRVLQLRDSPWVDGPGRTILETAARIDRSRVDYTIAPLVPDDGATHPLVVAARERGLPVQPVTDTGPLAPLVERVTGLVDRLGIEILHSSEFRTNLVALRCRRRRPHLKLVSTAHGWIANELRGQVKTLLDRILLRRFDRVIFVSQATRRRVPHWWVPDARAQVIHNALMLESYGQAARQTPRRPPVPGRPVRLLSVGRLSKEKGFDLLLRAVAELVRDCPRIDLTIAGTGPEEAALRGLGAELSLTDRVRYAGYVTDMPALYAECDLVVQSSLTEGLPNVMLETAYLGLPVVATDVGGTREVIEHGVNGWLVRAGSAAALAAGIRRYLDDPAASIAMAARGRAHIEANFSIAARAARQTVVYEAVARSEQ
ncbi:MAG: glycosyltransferase family 4 protein [Steroidobacteraceae bacterium]|nr:glycosyltransferase family 4 protein [Steroidobacteraceae bacterium]